MLDKLMEKVQKLEVSDDVGIKGQFRELLESFIADRMTDDKNQIKRGRCYVGSDGTFFRLGPFEQYLSRGGLRSYGRNRIAQRLTDLGGKSIRMILNGQRVSVYHIPQLDVQTEKFPVKEAIGDVI